LVAYLHSGDAHAHGSGQEIHQEDGHEEGVHEEEGHEEEGHQHSEDE